MCVCVCVEEKPFPSLLESRKEGWSGAECWTEDSRLVGFSSLTFRVSRLLRVSLLLFLSFLFFFFIFPRSLLLLCSLRGRLRTEMNVLFPDALCRRHGYVPSNRAGVIPGTFRECVARHIESLSSLIACRFYLWRNESLVVDQAEKARQPVADSCGERGKGGRKPPGSILVFT